MKTTLFVCLSLIACQLALGANTATISWTPVTSYTDDTPLPASDIASYTVSWAGKINGSQTVAAPATSVVVNVDPATVSFTVTLTTKPTAHYPNTTSSPGVPVTKAKPRVVQGVTVK